MHLNSPTRSWQVPPWPQGFGEQSSMSAKRGQEERLSLVQDIKILANTQLPIRSVERRVQKR